MNIKNLALAVLCAAAPAAAGTTHTVVSKDCLWNLSDHYYHNPFRWKVIHAANTNIVKDPHWIYPGQVLVIPDMPGPEVGELPARPVETAAAPVAVPEEPAQAAPEPEPAAAPEPPPAPEPDGLHADLPAGQVGYAIAGGRLKAPSSWKPDGSVILYEDGLEPEAAEGQPVTAALAGPAKEGDRFDVYRQEAPMEGEETKGLQFLQYVGTLRVDKRTSTTRYSLTVLKSVDTVQNGDVLKRKGS